MSDELRKTQQALAEAQAVLTRAREARDVEAGRVERAQGDLRANEQQLLTLDPDDRAFPKLQAERVGVGVGLEVLQRARLPRAEAALAEAEARFAKAQAEHDAAAKAAKFEELKAECTRLEADLEQRTRAFHAEVVAQLRAHNQAWEAARLLAPDVGEEWPNTSPWPPADQPVECLFAKLGNAVAPPYSPSPREVAAREAERAAARRQDEKFLQSLRAESAPRPSVPVHESGLTEKELAAFRTEVKHHQRLVDPQQDRAAGAAAKGGRR